MTPQEIAAEIDKSATDSKTLLISNYKTSDGFTCNYVVQFLPEGGYKELVRESLDILTKNTEKFTSEHKPADADDAEWAQAVEEQRASFNNSLFGEKPVKEVAYKRQLTKVGAYYAYADELQNDNLGTIVIKNVRALSRTIIEEPVEAKSKKSANVTRYKSIIRSALPVGQYIPQLNLAPDKVDLVRAVVMP